MAVLVSSCVSAVQASKPLVIKKLPEGVLPPMRLQVFREIAVLFASALVVEFDCPQFQLH